MTLTPLILNDSDPIDPSNHFRSTATGLLTAAIFSKGVKDGACVEIKICK